MNDNVIDLAKARQPDEEPKELVWACAHCGNTSFSLYNDGTTECRGCGLRGEYPDGAWSDWTPTENKPADARRAMDVYGSKEFAQRKVVQAIDADTTLVIVANNEGRIRAWCEYNHESTPAKKATVRYLCAQAASLILGDPPIPRPDDALPVDDDEDDDD